MTAPHRAGAPIVHHGSNLSLVWLNVLQDTFRMPGGEISPLVISIDGFLPNGSPTEDGRVRNSLDKFLMHRRKYSTEIVAFTIFPQRYLQISDGNREALYELYEDALPHIKAANPHLNSRGLYFERMIKFGPARCNENQLEFAIQEYLAGRGRRSKFHISIYDPLRDQSRQPYQTFPCLQSVSFVPSGNGLVVNAFYSMQYLIQRAYGNILGLCHLGAFVAGAMKLPLAQVYIMAGVERLDFPKKEVASLIREIERSVRPTNTV